MERVEAIFIKHFSNSNPGKGMKILRQKTMREKHRLTFTLGQVSATICIFIYLKFIKHLVGLIFLFGPMAVAIDANKVDCNKAWS